MTVPVIPTIPVPEHRQAPLDALIAAMAPGMRIAVTTHMNAGGDACGSVAAAVRLLAARGLVPHAVLPTGWPDMFDFLLDGVDDRSGRGAAALRDIDVLLVLDASDVRRLGALADAVRALRVPRLVLDHHEPSPEPPGDVVLADTAACATAELVFDLATAAGLAIDGATATALYTGVLTDTGGFRFSNTSPRAHLVAAELLSYGVDPEAMYRRIYASQPIGRVHLLREALESLEIDEAHGLAWISLAAGALERYGVKGEDLDGLVDHPRSIAGTRLALFFRDLGHGKVKVSFRSVDTDVNALARQFGGGGHARAAGALIEGSLESVRTRVLESSRAVLS